VCDYCYEKIHIHQQSAPQRWRAYQWTTIFITKIEVNLKVIFLEVDMEVKLLTWNPEYLPDIFGLTNTGSLCYLNSLTQSLLSCTSIHETMKDQDSANRYGKLLTAHYIGLANNNHPTKSEPYACDSVEPIFAAINAYHSGRRDNLIHGRHEDVHEGFAMFLATVENRVVEDLFHVRHTCTIECAHCAHRHELNTDACRQEIFIDLSSVNSEKLDSRKKVIDMIKENKQYPRDYMCENCHVKNTYDAAAVAVQENIKQVYRLARLSSVIVLLFKKYNGACEWNTPKKKCYFPNKMRFRSKQGTLVYKVVAQVEHSGDIGGGHYICHVLRRKPKGYHKRRAALIKEMYATRNDAEKEQSELENNARAAKKQFGVFTVNDSSVSYKPEGFVPSENTYLVFYHLMRIKN
jgi:ubiquitin C-terminal hydrolase